jgi:hypothetical protein
MKLSESIADGRHQDIPVRQRFRKNTLAESVDGDGL